MPRRFPLLQNMLLSNSGFQNYTSGTWGKAQVVAPNKATALKFKKYLTNLEK